MEMTWMPTTTHAFSLPSHTPPFGTASSPVLPCSQSLSQDKVIDTKKTNVALQSHTVSILKTINIVHVEISPQPQPFVQ